MNITQKFLTEHPKADTVLSKEDTLTAKCICDAAEKGDRAALMMVDEVGCMLGKAASCIACVVNPEVFAIGSGMSKAGNMHFMRLVGLRSGAQN